jgi:mannosyltransferase OCH1-like enzyme
MEIPKVIFQTSYLKQPQYVVDMILEKAPEYHYEHFTDKTIIQFFINNPLEEFPFVVNLFHRLKFGAHKADLFRYYYLYIKGGIFIDSDAMIETNIENIVGNNAFFSVNSYIEGTIFQGFIGCSPRNPIIYEALNDIYTIDVENLTKNYHLVTANLYTIIKEGVFDFENKLFRELESDGEKAVTVNDFGEPILIHYWKHKVIPKNRLDI